MFKSIKKLKGEKFAKQIRDYDNGILDIPNILNIVKHSGDDAEPLLAYLVSLKDVKIDTTVTVQSIDTLLNSAGYNYKIVTNQKEQDEISKYYAPGEKICTIGTDRWKKYHMVNVWRKDIDSIKRSDFTNPTRDDAYGTSCMSIQIGKSGGFISIKNRYNHKVGNCDNTLNSNPDNIINGLGASLKAHFKVDFQSQKTNIVGNYTTINKCIIKYNYEINGTFVAENAYIKDGKLVEIDKNTQIIMDYFLLDIPTKTITNLVDSNDCFPSTIMEYIKDKKIVITSDTNYQETDSEFAIIKM